MATSSITKKFVVKDREAFAKLKKDLAEESPRRYVVESKSLNEGRKKLATFVFR